MSSLVIPNYRTKIKFPQIQKAIKASRNNSILQSKTIIPNSPLKSECSEIKSSNVYLIHQYYESFNKEHLSIKMSEKPLRSKIQKISIGRYSNKINNSSVEPKIKLKTQSIEKFVIRDEDQTQARDSCLKITDFKKILQNYLKLKEASNPCHFFRLKTLQNSDNDEIEDPIFIPIKNKINFNRRKSNRNFSQGKFQCTLSKPPLQMNKESQNAKAKSLFKESNEYILDPWKSSQKDFIHSEEIFS